MSDDVVAVGRVGPPRGVRGDVFVEPWTDDPDVRFAPGVTLQAAAGERTAPDAVPPDGLTVEASSTAGGKLVVHFVGIDDRDAAQQLRGTQLLIAAADRPPIEDPDEYYASDLIGLAAEDVTGAPLGPVLDVVAIAGSDYLILDVDGRERLVPFVAAIVPTVDLAGERVVVDPPEGLFEL